jgi:hypothetical protein
MKKINFILIVVGVLALSFNVSAVADDCTYQYHVISDFYNTRVTTIKIPEI